MLWSVTSLRNREMVNVGEGESWTENNASTRVAQTVYNKRVATRPIRIRVCCQVPSLTILLAHQRLHAFILLKLILNRRNCDSWTKLSQHLTVIGLSLDFKLYVLQHNCYPLSSHRSQPHTLTSVLKLKRQWIKEHLRRSSIRTRFRPTSSQERKCCWLGRECSSSSIHYWK